MKHLDEELSAYLAGELGVEEKKSVEEHIGRCARCASDLADLRKLDAFLDFEDSLEVPSSFADRVLSETHPRPKRTVRRAVAVLALAAVVAFFAFLLSRRMETMQEPQMVQSPPAPVEKTSPPEQREEPLPVEVPQVIAPPAVAGVSREDEELIAYLDVLENIELIQNFESLQNLDLAMVAATREELK